MSTSAAHSAYREAALIVALAFGCLTLAAPHAAAQEPPGAVAITVFTIDPDGTRSPVPGASVSISGPGNLQQAITDKQSMCRFSGLAPGRYQIDASVPGLSGSSLVTVTASVVTNVSVELQVALLKESIT